MLGTIYIACMKTVLAIEASASRQHRNREAKHLRVIYSTWNRTSKKLQSKETERSHPAFSFTCLR